MSSVYVFYHDNGTYFIDLKKVTRIFVSGERELMKIVFDESESGFITVSYNQGLIEEFQKQ